MFSWLVSWKGLECVSLCPLWLCARILIFSQRHEGHKGINDSMTDGGRIAIVGNLQVCAVTPFRSLTFAARHPVALRCPCRTVRHRLTPQLVGDSSFPTPAMPRWALDLFSLRHLVAVKNCIFWNFRDKYSRRHFRQNGENRWFSICLFCQKQHWLTQKRILGNRRHWK